MADDGKQASGDDPTPQSPRHGLTGIRLTAGNNRVRAPAPQAQEPSHDPTHDCRR